MEIRGDAAEDLTAPAAARDDLETYRRLRAAIVGGDLQPNERLVEFTLARRLGAGRTAVRAALVRLEQEGLVVLEPNRGARVRLVSDREALEIEEVRWALEAMLCRRAAERIGEADLAILGDVVEEMRRRVAGGDAIGYSELNSRFHQVIWSAADQQTASRLIANLKSQSIRFQYQTFFKPGRTERSLAEHVAIHRALAAHDPDSAEAAMRSHLREVVDTLRWAIEAQTRSGGWQGE